MKKVSKIRLRMPPVVRAIMLKKAFPSDRRSLFKTKEAHIKGAPQKIKLA